MEAWQPLELEIQALTFSLLRRYEIIGDKPGVAASAWLDATRSMKQQLDTTCNYFEQLEHPCAKWTAELAPIFKWSENWRNILLVTNAGVEYQGSSEIPYNEMIGMPTSCMVGSPCLAGAFLFSDRMAYHKVGIRFADSDLTVFALASLYTAITKSDLLKPAWEDMHFLISTHKAKTPLVPKTTGPYDAETFFRQYLLALGVPIAQASTYTSRGAPTHQFVMRNNQRALAPTSEFVVAITESWHANDRLGTFGRGDLIETVLTKLTAKFKGLKQGKKGTRHQPQFSVKEVLSTFKSHMIADEPHLNFDYPGFHMLGEQIRRALHDLFPDCKDDPVGLALWDIVFQILREATKGPQASSLLSKAAVILKSIIDAPGVSNKFSKEARNASSGGIPKDLAPNITPYNPKWTAELWEYFARHHHGVGKLPVTVASSTASHITFYNPDGKKAKFEKITAAAEQFWEVWSSIRLRSFWNDRMGVQREYTGPKEVQRKDGAKLAVQMPASVKSLGLIEREGFGVALLEEMSFATQLHANGYLD